jgi:hypothetical protein
MTDQHPQPTIRWKHRRRMAYMALITAIIVLFLVLFVVDKEKLALLDDIITGYYLFAASIIGAYVGFSTFDDKWNQDK